MLMALVFCWIGGTTVLLGVFTALGGVAVSLGVIGVYGTSLLTKSASFDEGAVTAVVVVIAIALECLGPGALSIDARLFGRREIVLPTM